MRLLILACVTALAVPQAATTQEQLSQKDRDAAIKYLEDTRAKFLASIDRLSEAQWTFKAGPDRWSIAEAAEHIAVSETTILQLVTERILKSPKVPADPARATDAKVIEVITDRSGKAQAPEMLKPTQPLAEPGGAHQGIRGGPHADHRLRPDDQGRSPGTRDGPPGHADDRRIPVGAAAGRAQRAPHGPD